MFNVAYICIIFESNHSSFIGKLLPMVFETTDTNALMIPNISLSLALSLFVFFSSNFYFHFVLNNINCALSICDDNRSRLNIEIERYPQPNIKTPIDKEVNSGPGDRDSASETFETKISIKAVPRFDV